MGRVELVNLRNVLASLYRTNARALEIAEQAGLAPEDLEQQARPKSTWWEIVRDAERRGKLRDVIDLALAENPTHKGLQLAAAGQLKDIEASDNEPVTWVHRDLTTDEVMVGKDDLLPALFLEVGGRVATSVVRIAREDGTFGSGFLIANDLVLTNRHVLPTRQDADGAEFHIGAQMTLQGLDSPGTKARAVSDGLHYADETLDWAIVRIQPIPDATPIPLPTVATLRKNDRVFIIQHPGGGPKQVALGVNTVMHVDESRIQYLTDTMPGSSGSPIFDRTWTLVGIHRAGGWLLEPESKQERFRNEGIPIAPIREALLSRGYLR